MAFLDETGLEHLWTDITAKIGSKADTVNGVVQVENGGTSATTAADARTNLGLGTAATQNIAMGSNDVFNKVVYNSNDGVTEVAQHLDFHKVGSTADYDFRMSIDANGNPTFNGKSLPIASGGTGATAKGATLLSNIGISTGTAAAPSTGVAGTIYIQYEA